MLRLWIENKELELTQDVQVAITKQFEDLTNPTSIINEWSKTVSIPFTKTNNRIFGYIFRPDRQIVAGSGTTGIYFNPLRKLDFRLEWGSSIIMMGYAKMTEIKQTAGNGTYSLTLFGQLGKIFQDIKKITFDQTSPDTDYIIDGSEYVEEEINQDLVADSWETGGQFDSILRKKGEEYYNVHEIIGFAPNNSFSEDFDYKTYQVTSNTSSEFATTLGDAFKTATGIDADTVIPDGMFPREIGEYRSYYQLPYIYWNKLFQMFQAKAESTTGYTFDLDETWFNEANPYWFNLVYMLKPLNSIKNITYNNIYGSTTNSPLICYTKGSGSGYHFGSYEPGMSWNSAQEQIPLLMDPTSQYPHYFNMDSHQAVDGQISVHFKFDVAYNNISSSTTVHIRNNSVFVIDVYMTDQAIGHPETVKIQLGRIAVKYSSSSYVPGNTTYTRNVGDKSLSGSGTWTLLDEDFSFTIPADMYSKQYKITWSLNGYNSNDSSLSMFVTSAPSTIYLGNITLYCKPNQLNLNVTPMIGKSYSTFTLNDLWNNDYNLFDEILKYCKMYRIGVSVDEFQKKISFKPFPRYFETYTVTDWTNKVDKSKDFTITPVTLENKYVMFNYDDNETKLGEAYKDSYGMNYGDYRLSTEYNFNSETKKLFDKIKTSIVNSDNVLSWSNLYTYHTVVFSFPAEIFVYNKDEDGKQVDIFGEFFFHNGIARFSTEESLHLRSVFISDDTKFQQVNNTYFYNQGVTTERQVTSYPKLDIVRGNNMCLFNIPMKNYTYLSNYSGKETIYSNFWETYINERYNIQNKKITCYVSLKPSEYNQFDWNKLVLIDNQLCIVNKIYDYDVTSSGSTKVDLITIQNIEGYRTNNYAYDYLLVEPSTITIPYDHYKLVKIKSSNSWFIPGGDWQDTLVIDTHDGPAGETDVIVGSYNEEHGGWVNVEMETEDDYISTTFRVSVGGTATVTTTPWYNEVARGSTRSVTMNCSSSSIQWYVYKIDKCGDSGRVVNISNTSGTGSGNITFSVPSTSSTGVVEVYLKDRNGPDMTSFRVNIT